MFGIKGNMDIYRGWKIMPTELVNVEKNESYSFYELTIRYLRGEDIVCFWFKNKHLVSLPCDEKVYARYLSSCKQTKWYIAPYTEAQFFDTDGKEWQLTEDSLSSKEMSLSLLGIRFESQLDGVAVFNYGVPLCVLIDAEIDELNAAKSLFLDHTYDDLEKLDHKESNVEVTNHASVNAIVVTTETHIDVPIEKRLGVVSAEVVFGLNIFKDIFSAFSDFFGGRNKSLQNALKEAKELVLSELRREAASLNADAIIAVDFDYS